MYGQQDFLTVHVRVLLLVAHDPGIRLRDIAASLDITERSAFGIITDLVEAGYVVKEKDGRRNRYRVQAHLPLPEPAARERTVGEVAFAPVWTRPRRKTRQSLVSLAKGDKIRTFREQKSTITASSSSTRTTQPRPYLSWVTRSRTANCSAGGSTGRTLKGLPGRRRRDAARAGFINTSMRPPGLRAPILGGPDAAPAGGHRRRPGRPERQRAVAAGICPGFTTARSAE